MCFKITFKLKMKNGQVKVEVKQSTIPSAGMGLFAITDIPSGSIIVEFKGRIRKPNENISDNRSLIRFADDFFLECPDSDLGSFVNDPIDFPTSRRKLYESLESEIPFYQIHPVARMNSYIKLNQKMHRAFLVATNNIVKGEEIFCHYGFTQWFMKEFLNGFAFEERMDTKGFPPRIYTFPAFRAYVNIFYPNIKEYVAEDFPDGTTELTLIHSNAETTVIKLDNYASMLRKTTFKN